ncbi:MAG: DUF5777 family beta-barrel protein [Flavobacteriales bacterium]|nr:DUF5777 family beta-barrel protein [Flavobacteriales bacterium]
MKKIYLFIVLMSFYGSPYLQEYVYRTFNDTRVINGHSVETLMKGAMDIRISHRFGDLLGENGGASSMFGLDDMADVRIGVEYGISNNLTIGLGRSKGAGPYRQLVDGFGKYKLLAQTKEKGMPVTLTLLGLATYDFQEASINLSSPTSYRETAHRFAYCTSLLIGRKFNDKFSIQISSSYVHRNYVAFHDQNGIFSTGISSRLKVSKMIGVIAEYHYLHPYNRSTGIGTYYNPMGLGIEFDTGGHIFQLNFTNSRGMGETQFIPYTSSDVMEGQFRMGFTISRVFKLRRPKQAKG